MGIKFMIKVISGEKKKELFNKCSWENWKTELFRRAKDWR